MKKKCLCLFLVFAIFGGVFFFTGKKDVIAENSNSSNKCEVKTNHYYFVGVIENIWYGEDWCLNVINKTGNIPGTCVNGTTAEETNVNRIDKNGNYYIINDAIFNLSIDGEIIDEDAKAISQNEFDDFYSTLEKIRKADNYVYVDEDGNYNSTNVKWKDNDDPDTAYVGTTTLPENNQKEIMKAQMVIPEAGFDVSIINSNTLEVTRKWTRKRASTIFGTDASSFANPYPNVESGIYDNKAVWHTYSLGIYTVTYKPSGCSKVVIIHVDEDNNAIGEDKNLEGVVGDSWNYNCPSEITDNGTVYELNTKEDTKFSGTFTEKTQHKYCYYKKPTEEVKTYNVKANFINKETNKKIVKSETVKTDLKDKQDYSYSCKAITNYDLITVDAITGTIDGKDAEVNCYYEEKEEKVATYNVRVNFLEKDTNKTLLDSKVIETNLEDKASYSYTCDNITNYDLINTGKITGTINGKDAEINCYYKKKTYMVTINYGEDEDCRNILESVNKSGLAVGNSVNIEVPSKIGKLKLTSLGVYSTAINPAPTLKDDIVNFKMPAKNVSVCVVYTPQTGSSNLSIVLVIGLITLGGSIYFIQKRKNNV